MSAQVSDNSNSAMLAAALDEIRQELARLNGRVLALEAALRPAPVAPAAAPPPEKKEEPPLTEELLVVLGAAVAAYLGKKAPIRQIRLLSSGAWAQQGRVTIQASHHLS